MKPSLEQNESLLSAFDYLNEQLFEGKCPTPMLMFSRNKNLIGGYFAPDRWTNDEGLTVHEIGLNANVMKRDILDQYSTLAHEMAHLYQHCFGKPGAGGYHNEEWAELAKKIGLRPFGPDGKETGRAIDHEIIEGGAFEVAMLEMPSDKIFPWIAEDLQVDTDEGGKGGGKGEGKSPDEEEKPKKQGKRCKYTCPVCGLNVWAKYDAKIICGDCNQMLIGAKVENE